MAGSSWIKMVVTLSRAILYDRDTRRRGLGSSALLMLALFAAGLWLVDDWISVSPMRFAAWWLGVAMWTMVVMLFSLFDALAAIREERDKMK